MSLNLICGNSCSRLNASARDPIQQCRWMAAERDFLPWKKYPNIENVYPCQMHVSLPAFPSRVAEHPEARHFIAAWKISWEKCGKNHDFLNFGPVFLTAVKSWQFWRAHCSPSLVGLDNSVVFTSYSVQLAPRERPKPFHSVNKYSFFAHSALTNCP